MCVCVGVCDGARARVSTVTARLFQVDSQIKLKEVRLAGAAQRQRSRRVGG